MPKATKKVSKKSTKKPLEIIAAQKEVKALAKQTKPFTLSIKKIKTESEQLMVSSSLVNLKTVTKEIKSRLNARIRPLQEVVKLVKADYKPLIDTCIEQEGIHKRMLIEYEAGLREKAEKKAEKAAQKAEKQGAPEYAEELREEAATKEVVPKVAGISTRKQATYEVYDFSRVPDQYKTIDSGAVWKAIRAGVTNIPGIEIGERTVIAVGSK